VDRDLLTSIAFDLTSNKRLHDGYVGSSNQRGFDGLAIRGVLMKTLEYDTINPPKGNFSSPLFIELSHTYCYLIFISKED
jgi:hypothetical protein